MNELYVAVTNFKPVLAIQFTRQEIEDHLSALIDKLVFIGAVEERSGDRE